MKYLLIILSLFIKYHVHRGKPVDPPLAASEVHKKSSEFLPYNDAVKTVPLNWIRFLNDVKVFYRRSFSGCLH